MDSDEKVARMAEAISEGLSCLAVFLCGPSFRRLRSKGPELLRRWEADYAPTFRRAMCGVRPSNRSKVKSALDEISRAASGGADLDAPESLAALRLAIREAIIGFEFPLPDLTTAEAACCELHGPSCPMLERAAKPD